jgi:hypothetical protein
MRGVQGEEGGSWKSWGDRDSELIYPCRVPNSTAAMESRGSYLLEATTIVSSTYCIISV